MSSLAGENHVSKRLWSFIKTQRKDHCSVPPIQSNGNTYTNDSDKAETLNNYFCSVFTARSCDEYPGFEEVPFPSIPPISINVD